MKTLIENNLYSVEVPSDARSIELTENNTCLFFKSNGGGLDFSLTEQRDRFRFVGEVNKNELTFDPVKYVKAYGNDMYLDLYGYEESTFKNRKEQFFKLLQSKGIYFENPMGKLENCCSGRDCGCMGMPINISSMEELQEWEESENKVIKGKLIILEKL